MYSATCCLFVYDNGMTKYTPYFRGTMYGTSVQDYYHSPLSCTEFKEFWISWFGGYISIGSGLIALENFFMSTPNVMNYQINYVGISTYLGESGTWKLYMPCEGSNHII